MSAWPYDWEEYFDGVPPEQISDTHLELLDAFPELSPDQIDVLERILFELNFLETLARRELDKCNWSADILRANSIPTSIRRTADIRAWHRFRANRQCLDACQDARSAIFHGNWIIAIFLALVAGNKSQEDLALIGSRRGAVLPKKGHSKPRDKGLAERNDDIHGRASILAARHSDWGKARIARRIAADLAKRGVAIGWESVRKIMR
jgi:hypothetical protein